LPSHRKAPEARVAREPDQSRQRQCGFQTLQFRGAWILRRRFQPEELFGTAARFVAGEPFPRFRKAFFAHQTAGENVSQDIGRLVGGEKVGVKDFIVFCALAGIDVRFPGRAPGGVCPAEINQFLHTENLFRDKPDVLRGAAFHPAFERRTRLAEIQEFESGQRLKLGMGIEGDGCARHIVRRIIRIFCQIGVDRRDLRFAGEFLDCQQIQQPGMFRFSLQQFLRVFERKAQGQNRKIDGTLLREFLRDLPGGNHLAVGQPQRHDEIAQRRIVPAHFPEGFFRLQIKKPAQRGHLLAAEK